jgi:hypothetical protein
VLLANVPLPHLAHVSAPESGATVPSPHGLHSTVCSVFAKRPGPQISHSSLPVPFPDHPFGHAAHSCCAVSPLNLPGVHCGQDVLAESGDARPNKQWWHESAPVTFEKDPGLHAVQVCASGLLEYLPVSQLTQEARMALLCASPGSQALGVALPGIHPNPG